MQALRLVEKEVGLVLSCNLEVKSFDRVIIKYVMIIYSYN